MYFLKIVLLFSLFALSGVSSAQCLEVYKAPIVSGISNILGDAQNWTELDVALMIDDQNLINKYLKEKCYDPNNSHNTSKPLFYAVSLASLDKLNAAGVDFNKRIVDNKFNFLEILVTSVPYSEQKVNDILSVAPDVFVVINKHYGVINKFNHKQIKFINKKLRNEMIKKVIQLGADVDYKNVDSKNTVLHEAAYLNDSDLVQLLLSMGADANSKNINGDTPLYTILLNPQITKKDKEKLINLMMVKSRNLINFDVKNKNGLYLSSLMKRVGINILNRHKLAYTTDVSPKIFKERKKVEDTIVERINLSPKEYFQFYTSSYNL